MRISAMAAAIVWSLLGGTAISQVRYEVCQVGSLDSGRGFTRAQAINDLGHVIGESDTATGFRAFFWDRRNGIRDLTASSAGGSITANALNNRDEVTGSIFRNGALRAFVWSEAKGIQLLQDDADPFQPVAGTSINDLGEVVGTTQSDPFIWDRRHGVRRLGPILDLQTVFPKDLNNFGKITGSGGSATAFRTFLFDARSFRQRVLELDEATAINALGQVAGFIVVSEFEMFPRFHAAVWDRANGMRDIDPLPREQGFSEAKDINNAGTVVGTTTGEAFIWTERTGMLRLNDLIVRMDPDAQFVTLREAQAINNFGWIAATGGDLRNPAIVTAFVLIPRTKRGLAQRRLCDE
jgi:probable HAF family extracellular repeat protein